MKANQPQADTATVMAAQEYANGVRGLTHKKTAAVDFLQGARYAAERFRWHDAKEELPPEGETVIARKRGAWTSLAVYANVNGAGLGKPTLRWIFGNSYRDWQPDEWMHLPE